MDNDYSTDSSTSTVKLTSTSVSDQHTSPLPIFDGQVHSHKARVCLDTGASACFVSLAFAKSCGLSLVQLKGDSLPVVLADGSNLMTKLLYKVPFRLGNYSGQVLAYGLDLSDSFQLVLGMPWLSEVKPNFWDSGGVTFTVKGHKYMIRAPFSIQGRTQGL